MIVAQLALLVIVLLGAIAFRWGKGAETPPHHQRHRRHVR